MESLLENLLSGLLPYIEKDPLSPNKGAVHCKSCGDHHTRGGEAAFPFVVLGKLKGDEELVETGLRMADWLLTRQNLDGSWNESPSEWTGTTVFQLMSLAATVGTAGRILSPERQERYAKALSKAAEWVNENIGFRRVTTNYVAAGAAALALASKTLDGKEWAKAARRLARRAAARINADGLVEGEGRGRRILQKIYVKPKGIDIGYGLEMTLASLSLYAILSHDDKTAAALQRALAAHLYFVYPDGSLDNSLGSRGYKWTIYGSKTAHGSQMAWASGASHDGRMARAQRLGTDVLQHFFFGGLLSNGPNQQAASGHPCIYPSVLRAVNLAFVLSYFPPPVKSAGNMPCREEQWIKRWASLNSAILRRAPWMATISGYDESTEFDTAEGRRVFRVPCGGTTTYLYHDDWGPVQAATQLDYWNWEPLHLPPRPRDTVTFTPRIEIRCDRGSVSSAATRRVSIETSDLSDRVEVTVRGTLSRDRPGPNQHFGTYVIAYDFNRRTLTKRYEIRLRNRAGRIDVVEPVLLTPGARLDILDTGLAVVKERRRLRLECKRPGPWQWVRNKNLQLFPMPALMACPAIFRVEMPAPGTYRLELVFECGTD